MSAGASGVDGVDGAGADATEAAVPETAAASADGAPVVVGLYVPGDRPDRFEKAATSGAEMIILDLEDAVAPERKDEARQAVLDLLQARAAGTAGTAGTAGEAVESQGALSVVQVRVNSGARGDDDVRALAALSASSSASSPTRLPAVELRVPKVETAERLDHLAALAPGLPITALIESALGVENAYSIAARL